MAKRYRLVVLGDPHIHPGDTDLWRDAIADVNALRPDAVLILGDLTGGIGTGSPQRLDEAVAVLRGLEAPWQSIIGNHDLEWSGHATDEQAVADFLRGQGRATPWFRWDLPAAGVAILGLSNTRWRSNPVTPNEIVIDDAQLDWFAAELADLADTPVIVACHTPPVGCGLLHMPELHAQVGNALVNQNHQPHRIAQLLWHHPNVLFWFSGHNHLGQHYRDALSIRLGIHFVHTGVVGRRTRDGFRHSRVLEIGSDDFTLDTFDHTLRRIDPALRYRAEHRLADWLNYRHNHRHHRRVAMDPATMAQGPGPGAGPVTRGAVRFAVFSDAHLVEPVMPVQNRVIEWGLQQLYAHGATELLLNGDLTHHARAEECQLILHRVAANPLKIHYLPGNNEGRGPFPEFAETPGFSWVSERVCRLAGWPGSAWALATVSDRCVVEAIRELAPQLPPAGHVLIVAHFPPPSAADEPQALALLEREGRHITWLCGHLHAGRTDRFGSIQAQVCGGLDPIKVRDQTPEVFLGCWDGQTLQLTRRQAGAAVLAPAFRRGHRVGLAYKGMPLAVLEDALAEGISALQFRDAVQQDPQAMQEPIARFRRRYPQGVLSIHLPNPGVDDAGLQMEALEPHLRWAEALGLDDWTLHLPQVPASRLFDLASERFLETPWARACLAAYGALARRAIGAGARLSLENVNNNHLVPPEEELLSCRPWHLRRVIEQLRRDLRSEGMTAAQVQTVGMIFDTGHAFTDPVVSKQHGLGDWIHQVGDLIQIAHIHQSVVIDGKYKRHVGIDTATGARINHLGLVALLEESLPRPIVLLAEVREREAALRSGRTLLQILATYADRPVHPPG